MISRGILLSGAVAVAFYVAATVYGGFRHPGYSHRAQAISELIAIGAPNKGLLDALYCIYNGLVIVFGVAVLQLAGAALLPQVGAAGSVTMGFLAAGALIAVGGLGLILTLFFPMDPRGAPPTVRGRVHLALAGVISLSTILAILFGAIWLGNQQGLSGAATYSFVTLAVVIASGVGAAVATARGSRYLGVWERITIGGFLQWLFVISIWLYQAAPLLAP